MLSMSSICSKTISTFSLRFPRTFWRPHAIYTVSQQKFIEPLLCARHFSRCSLCSREWIRCRICSQATSCPVRKCRQWINKQIYMSSSDKFYEETYGRVKRWPVIMWGASAFLDQVFRESPIKSWPISRDMNQVRKWVNEDFWRRIILGRGNHKCKGPENRSCWHIRGPARRPECLE